MRVHGVMVSIVLSAFLLACGGGESGGEAGNPPSKNVYVEPSLGGGVLGQISAGSLHTCALTSSGGVLCWGYGPDGRIGVGRSSNPFRPVTVVDENNVPLSSIVQISVAGSSCALSAEGGVYCWGAGNDGRLGNGDTVNKYSAVRVLAADGDSGLLSDVIQISVNGSHACALTSNGGVVCWGKGDAGQLGNGDTVNKEHPVTVVAAEGSSDPLTGIVQIASGGEHTCALTQLGGVLCWGNGGNGRLGNGVADNKSHPVTVVDGEGKSLGNIVQISSGGIHTCALNGEGSIFCWGRGSEGQLGNDDRSDQDHPVAVVETEGSTDTLTDIVQISSGGSHTCAMNREGHLACWGLGGTGQLGNDGFNDKDHPVAVVEAEGSTEPLGNIAQVDSGGNHTCAMTTGGRVLCWGRGAGGQIGHGNAIDSADKEAPLTVVEKGGGSKPLRLGIKTLPWICYSDGTCQHLAPTENYQDSGGGMGSQISTGTGFSCALTYQGGVQCWGEGNSGRLGNNANSDTDHPVAVVAVGGGTDLLEDIVSIDSGYAHSCALSATGGVVCWGVGENGRLGNNASTNQNHPVAVVESGTGTGLLADIVQVGVGEAHSCALTTAGGVLCWGKATDGQLGNDSTTDSERPVAVVEDASSSTPLNDIIQISVGDNHTCALTVERRVVCWGNGTNGQLGNGGTQSASAPVSVSLEDVVQISSGASHTCALKFGGGVFCWGSGTDGRLGNGDVVKQNTPVAVVEVGGGPTPLGNIAQIRTGGEHTCALNSSGEVFCWGKGTEGQLGNDDVASSDYPVAVAETGDIVQVAVGDEHTCALTNGGKVLCWGDGTNGELGNDDVAGSDSPVAVVDTDGSTRPLRLGVQQLPWACYRDGTCQTRPPVERYHNDGGGTLQQIALGVAHTCALSTSGQVRCWGYNGSAQLGVSDDAFGNTDYPELVVTSYGGAAIEDVVQVALGGRTSCALAARGTVQCWGAGDSGQVGDGNDGDGFRERPVTVVAGEGSTDPLRAIVQITVGESNVCALTVQGNVLCWGSGLNGILGNGDSSGEDKHYPLAVVEGAGSTEPLGDIVQVDLGDQHACAVSFEGIVQCWGAAISGQLGNNDPDLVSSSYPVTVVAGDGSSDPLRDIVQVSGGETHTCALTSTGRVWCWGTGTSGQLGQGSATSTNYPVAVVSGSGSTNPLTGIIQISAGGYHTCALKSSGGVVCWGSEGLGLLGNGNNSSTKRPYPVAVVETEGSSNALANIVQIDVGNAHTCALRSTGGVACWGQASLGRLGNQERANNAANFGVAAPVAVTGGSKATYDFRDASDEPVSILRFIAKSVGTAGNSIQVTIENATTSGKKYTVTNGTITETYDDVVIGAISVGAHASFASSQLVEVWNFSSGLYGEPANIAATNLAGGTDDTTSGLNVGVKKRPWGCFRDGVCQHLLPTDSY